MNASVNYQVETETFTGPFDLLLKAINDGQLDVQRVSLGQITAAYLTYWRANMPNLVAASDFLYMAALILEMKSKALLPVREELLDEDLFLGLEESLVDHIQEYQLYKNMALTLKERKAVFERIYGRHEGEELEKEIELVDVSLKDLVFAFKKVYDEAAKREAVVAIPAEEISIEDRILEIKRLVAGRTDGVPFEDIFLRKTRLEVIVTFLAVLELCKQRFIRIAQGRRFGSILIFAVPIVDQFEIIEVEENGTGTVAEQL